MSVSGTMQAHIPKLLLTMVCFLGIAWPSQAAEQPNILFIAVDDLRPELGCYGSEIAVTPNLDALAADGLLFQRAYCQQAICRPSRASLMTGMRPESTGLFHNYVALRELQPGSFLGTAGLSAAGLALAGLLDAEGLLASDSATVGSKTPIRPDIDPTTLMPHANRISRCLRSRFW